MSKAKRIKKLKERFIESLTEVSNLIGMSTLEVSRNDYVRISVDLDIKSRLNKEELVEIGGFAKVKEQLFIDESKRMPKILVLDIETAPLEIYAWNLWGSFTALNQVIEHTTILSYSAKFIGDDKVYYNDVRNEKNVRNDKKIVSELVELINQADFTLSQNGVRFDLPKIRYRAIVHGLPAIKVTHEIDTLKIAKKFLGFDSNKLEHLTHLLCKKHKKLTHKKFSGFDLWKECLDGNIEAYEEMEEYNKVDVLSLEELYLDHIAPYDTMTPNFSSFTDSPIFRCNCGNDTFIPAGFHLTKKSKFEKFRCNKCGKTHRSSKNLHNKEKRDSLLV